MPPAETLSETAQRRRCCPTFILCVIMHSLIVKSALAVRLLMTCSYFTFITTYFKSTRLIASVFILRVTLPRQRRLCKPPTEREELRCPRAAPSSARSPRTYGGGRAATAGAEHSGVGEGLPQRLHNSVSYRHSSRG